MRFALRVVGIGLLAVSAGAPAGCSTGVVPGAPDGEDDNKQAVVTITLGTEDKSFLVQDGASARHTLTVSPDLPDGTITGGSLSIDPAAISVKRTEAAKLLPAQQSISMIVISVWLAPPADLGDSTCEAGEEYGPFSVTLDQNDNVINIEPRSSPLTDATIGLLTEFVLCIEVQAPGINATIDIATLSLVLESTTASDCNKPCGFDDAAPDGQRAAALCSIDLPSNAFAGSPTDGDSCSLDSECNDGNECTLNECIGAVVKLCSSSPAAECDGQDSVLFPGDTVTFEFDHRVESAAVNGEDVGVDTKVIFWTAQGLAAGPQTLLVEWQNRAGATPSSGCHEVEVFVQ